MDLINKINEIKETRLMTYETEIELSKKIAYECGILLIHGVYYGPFSSDFEEYSREKLRIQDLSFGIDHLFNYDPESKLFVDATCELFSPKNERIETFYVDDDKVILDIDDKTRQTTHYAYMPYSVNLINGELHELFIRKCILNSI